MKRGLFLYFLGFSLFQLLAVTLLPLDAATLRILHAGLLLAGAFFLWEGPRPLALGGGLLSLAVCAGLLLRWRPVALSGGVTGPAELLLAALALLCLLAAGLICSPTLTLLAGVFLLYNFAGPLIPGLFGHAGFSLRRVLRFFFWGTQGVFGTGAGVSSTYLFTFVLFGALLRTGGFLDLVNDLALRAVGKSRGGAAKIAVLSSALLGTVNGSAVANVAATGSLTIPMMERSGYPKELAAAVEAAASTGGQFMPPVMGAVGFVMAELLGVRYTAVMAAALLPALLFYGALLLAVDLQARRLGLREAEESASAPLSGRLHLLLPLILLVGLMAAGYTPLYSCVAAALLTPLVSSLRAGTRRSPSAWLEALAEGARSAVTVGVSCLIIGLIIGTVTLTGVGLTAGSALLRLANAGRLLSCGLAAALLSLLLGTGVPGVAAYVIVSAVAAPALVQAGAPVLAAHLFCLFYACLANLTPPVAISAVTAAGIAGANRTKTALRALSLAVPGLALPLCFLLRPALLLGLSPFGAICLALLPTLFGVALLTCACQGWCFGPCPLWRRLLLFLGAGLLLFLPLP